MYSIAVLDDRNEQRTTLMRSIGTALPEGWDCIECPLLEDRALYSDWLTKNQVYVLLADQVLNEQTSESVGNVDYKGHEVIKSIRRTYPDFPVFLVTAHPDDEDLAENDADAEDVMTRTQLTSDAKKYVTRMVRAGQRFHAEHERRLAEITELATKVALGTASDRDKEDLKRLQIALGSERAASVDLTREETLEKVDERVARLEQLQGDLAALVDREDDR